MRILHVITSLRIGGAEKMLTELVPASIQHGHQVEIALLDATPTPLTKAMAEKGVTMHALGYGYKAIYNPWAIKGIRKLLKNFDVVHTHNTTAQFFSAMAICNLAKKPILITSEHNTYNRRRKLTGGKSIDRWMYSKYSKIVCVSEAVRDALKAHLPDQEDKLTVIDNGIDFDKFALAKPTYEFKFKFPGKKIIVMVAAFRKQKDHAALIKALGQLPSYYALVLAGDGETMVECQALAKSMDVDDRIAFLGFRTDVPQILQSADVIVQSTHYEGLSLSLIESMASGKPFIASDVDGITQVAKGIALLFNDGDYKTLASLIAKVTTDKDLQDEVSRSCQNKAKEYNITHTLDSYLQLYDTLTPNT